MKAPSSGFTLVEVLVSAVLFLVATTGILATIVQTRKPAIDSDRNARAALYAQKTVEKFRSSLGADTWVSAAWNAGTYAIPADAEFPGYGGTYTVTDDAATGGKSIVFNVVY